MSEQRCPECGYQLTMKGKRCRVCRSVQEWERDLCNTMERLFTKRIAKNLQKFDVQPKEDHVQQIFDGQGLFLYGDAGSGKTLYACALALQVKRRGVIFPETPSMKVQFVNTLNLLDEIQASFNQPKKQEQDGTPRKTTEEIKDFYNTVDLLVLDDLGTERPTEWTLQIMHMIIINRYEDLLPTIITSNLGLKGLSEQLDDRLSSRIYEMCEPVSFGKDDYRLKR